MAETHVAPRSGAEDDGADLPTDPEFDLPWRVDVPPLRQLRIVRKEPEPEPAVADPRFRLSTRSRLGVVAVLSAALGLAGSYGNAGDLAVPAVNPVADAHVLGAEHWHAAAPGAGTWQTGTTQLGRQDPAISCAAGTLPADASAFRRSTATDGRGGTGEQHVTRAGSPRAANALIASWLAGVRSCQRQAYGRDTQMRTLGTYPGVADGLTVVGVFYSLNSPGPFGTKHGAHLFAVGRNGRLVTTLELNVPGAPGRVPVGQFTAVAKRALAELR